VGRGYEIVYDIPKLSDTTSAWFYVNGAGNNGMVKNGVWTPRIPDRAGSTVLESGTLSNYEGYGSKTAGPNLTATSNPYGYDGYYTDSESGLCYLNNRYYDPTTQRFTQQDPALDGGNWYLYCYSDPVNITDPSGLKPGDLFDSMDAAARDFAFYINAKSISENREYGSFIYAVTVKVTHYSWKSKYVKVISWSWKKGLFTNYKLTYQKVMVTTYVTKYSYVNPKKGTSDNVGIPINWLGLKKKVAEIHTHAAYDRNYNNDDFSKQDISNKYIQYLATPLGTLRKYDPSSKKNTVIYTDIPFDPHHPLRP